jgi:hypothetical protein
MLTTQSNPFVFQSLITPAIFITTQPDSLFPKYKCPVQSLMKFMSSLTYAFPNTTLSRISMHTFPYLKLISVQIASAKL